MLLTKSPDQIDIKRINALVERQSGRGKPTGTGGSEATIPRGSYTGLVVQAEQIRNKWGQHVTRAVLEVADGEYAGQRVSVTAGRSRAELLHKAAGSGTQITFDVFLRRRDDGREFSAVNLETICLVSGSPAEKLPGLPAHVRAMMQSAGGNPARMTGPFFMSTPLGGQPEMAFPPTLEQITAAAAEYRHGFACIGSKEARRQIVPWLEAYELMESCTSAVIGEPVFLSMFTFAEDFLEYVQNHKKPGSMAGYRGPAYSPLLVFDIDRTDASGQASPEVARQDTMSLLVTLLELGVPDDLIHVHFSGGKGYHVSCPSTLAGAMPAENFPDVAKAFCLMIATEAGIEIDKSLYRVLQPLRATNSRHEKSGLFKTFMTVEEFLDTTTAETLELARQPRMLVPSPLMHEPIPVLAELWFHAEQITNGSIRRGERPPVVVGGDARIFAATWEFLIGGAPDGERAVALFRAAANLADFESRDDLIRALLDRATALCGLPPTEAATHIDSALRRAAEGRPE